MLATLEVRPQRPAPREVRPEPTPPPPLPPTPVERLLENRHFRPVLVASSPEHMAARRPFGGSILAHILAAFLIVTFTRPAPPEPAGAGEDTTLIYLPRIRAVETSAPPKPAQGIGGGGGGSGAGVLVVANPPPKGFQTIIAPTEIPTGIPTVDLNERALDPRDYTGIGVEGGVSYGVVGGTGKVDPSIVAGLEGVVYAEGNPDVRYIPAALVHQVAPAYPPALRLAGVEGSVDARFVIDTLGIVEPASVEVLESTHAGFEAAAMQAVRSARFSPARLGNARVRQLTKQRITFRIN